MRDQECYSSSEGIRMYVNDDLAYADRVGKVPLLEYHRNGADKCSIRRFF